MRYGGLKVVHPVSLRSLQKAFRFAATVVNNIPPLVISLHQSSTSSMVTSPGVFTTREKYLTISMTFFSDATVSNGLHRSGAFASGFQPRRRAVFNKTRS